MAQAVVDGRVIAGVHDGAGDARGVGDLDGDVRPLAGKGGAEQGVHVHQLHVDPDAGLRREVFVDQGFDDVGLVAAGADPERDGPGAVLRAGDVADLVIVDDKGVDQALRLVAQAGKEGAVLRGRGDVRRVHPDPVDLQRLAQHLGDPVAAGANVDLVGGKHLREPFPVPDQLGQLVVHGPEHGQLVAGMPGGLLQAGDRPAQALLNRDQLRLQPGQAALDLVVAVRVRGGAGDVQDLAVNAVELQHTLLHPADDVRHFAENDLHAQGVLPGRQADPVGRFVRGGGGLRPPGLGVGEGQGAEFGEGDLPVHGDLPVDIHAADEILLVMEGQAVIAVSGDFKLPLDPLAGVLPGVAAHGVVQQVPRAGGIDGGGGLILHRIEHLGGGPVRGLGLDPDAHVLRSSGQGGDGLRVGEGSGIVAENEPPDQHRLLQGERGQGVRSLFQPEAQGLRDISVAVIDGGVHPLRHFRRGGLQVVALVVLPPADGEDAVFIRDALRAGVRVVAPDALESDEGKLPAGQLPVQEKGPLDLGVLPLTGVIADVEVVPAGFLHLELPLGEGFLAGQQGIPRHAFVTVYHGHLSRLILIARGGGALDHDLRGRPEIGAPFPAFGPGQDAFIHRIGAYQRFILRNGQLRYGRRGRDRAEKQQRQQQPEFVLHVLPLLSVMTVPQARRQFVPFRSGISARVTARSSPYIFRSMATSVYRSLGRLNFALLRTKSPPQVQ